MGLLEFFASVNSFFPILRTLFLLTLLVIAFDYMLGIITRELLKRARTKKQISNIEIFSRIFKYAALFFLLIVAVFSYAGSWTGLGITAGLLSAALGWALQKPITGIAAWLMVVTKRPFEIGDRVVIGGLKGDIEDITLTHLHIKEVGGLVAGEENSGRIIMVPNSVLFEQNIINYTLENEYVLVQVVTTVTYEGNLDKAIKLILDSAKKQTKEFSADAPREPYTRIFFQPSGIDIHVRYFAPARRLQEVSSSITEEIYRSVKKAKDVEFAYPHTVFIKKKR